MKLSKQNIVWAAAGILFALASAAIHYQVKVEMAGDRRSARGKLGDIQVGNESPDFSAADLQGRSVALAELRTRKAIVLDFWATWCGPCMRALPDLQELHEEFRERGVEIVAVNLGEDLERVREFVERNEYTFRVVTDRDSVIGSRFGVSAIPTTVVIDTDGRIESIRIGYSPTHKARLRQMLERLLKESVSAGSDAM